MSQSWQVLKGACVEGVGGKVPLFRFLRFLSFFFFPPLILYIGAHNCNLPKQMGFGLFTLTLSAQTPFKTTRQSTRRPIFGTSTVCEPFSQGINSRHGLMTHLSERVLPASLPLITPVPPPPRKTLQNKNNSSRTIPSWPKCRVLT